LALASDKESVSSSIPYFARFAALRAAASSRFVLGMDIGSARTCSEGGLVEVVVDVLVVEVVVVDVVGFFVEVESCSSSFLLEILTGW